MMETVYEWLRCRSKKALQEDHIMGCPIDDKYLIDALCELTKEIREQKDMLPESIRAVSFQHPLDEEVIGKDGLLEKLLANHGSISYAEAEDLDGLWKKLLEKSIVCLRFFDKREPFMNKQDPKIVAYGLDQLADYHHRYTDFESLMYGASSRYRDHVFHVVRVWLLGVFCLLKPLPRSEDENATPFICRISLDGGAEMIGEFNFFEKISMWTIIALCHDLGYPLERAEQILSKTKDMMRAFVPNANIWNDFNYSGVQDNINDYILKFISTKMVRHPNRENVYVGRIQPKYFLKYAKSLEQCQHGIISTVIIFKLLIYFMESDFNLNDDYTFGGEDGRQFYIRREILRSIAAHTCPDAYNINVTTFSSFLFLIDELQEWGRKSWIEMYTGSNKPSAELDLKWFTPEGISYTETFDLGKYENSDRNSDVIERIIRVFTKQYTRYKSTFRDGQGLQEKKFDLHKEMFYQLPVRPGGRKRSVQVQLALLAEGESRFEIGLTNLPRDDQEEFRKAIQARTKGLLYSDDISIRP